MEENEANKEQETKEEKIEEPSKKNKENLTLKVRENPWILATFVLGILAIILLFFSFTGITGGAITGGVVSEEVVSENFINFAEGQVGAIEILDIEKEKGFYRIDFSSEETGDSSIYITLDGQNLVSGLIPIGSTPTNTNTESPPQDIPKSDNPVVELFVMTHCPYGTQAEKGFIPMMKAMGDSLNAEIRFVHYFLHDPEETETPRQVCIREEQEEKFIDYLECFLEDGDSERCLTKVGIDKAAMENCISSGKADEYYAEDSKASEDAGVRGSPTLVIDGQIVSSGRSADAYLETVCSAFNNVPSACSLVLDSASPSPGFGSGTTSGTSGTAQC